MKKIPVGIEFSTQVEKVRGDVKKLRQDVKGIGKDSSQATTQGAKGFDLFQNSMLRTAVSAAGLYRVLKTVITASNELRAAQLGLISVGTKLGNTQGELLKASKALTEDGLLSPKDANTSIKNLLATNFTLKESVKLINVFKDSAAFGRQGSLGFGEAVRSATEGIKNQNSILVDNAGITKNLSIILKEAGFSAQDLSKASSDVNVRMALFNGLVKEGNLFTGDAAKLTGEFAGKTSKLSASFEIFLSRIGDVITKSPEVISLIEGITTVFETLTSRVDSLVSSLKILQPLLVLSDVAALFTSQDAQDYLERTGRIQEIVGDKVEDLKAEIVKNEARLKVIPKEIQQIKSGTATSQVAEQTIPELEGEKKFLERRIIGISRQIGAYEKYLGITDDGTGTLPPPPPPPGPPGPKIFLPIQDAVSLRRTSTGARDNLTDLNPFQTESRASQTTEEQIRDGATKGIEAGFDNSKEAAERFGSSTASFLRISTQQGLDEAFKAAVTSSGFKLLEFGLTQIGKSLFSGGTSNLFSFLPFAGGVEAVRGGIKGRDSIPALIQQDESVLTVGSTKWMQDTFGVGFIDKLNRVTRRGFAGGAEAIQPLSGGGGSTVIAVWKVDGVVLDRQVISPAQQERERNLN